MSYRGLHTVRTMAQQDGIFEQAGHTAIWRTYVSASGGVAAAGFGATAFYAERVITALFTRVTQPETQTPGGQVVTADFQMTTRQPIGRNDELRWRGVDYRVESDPVPARITNTYVSLIKRVDP